MSKTNFKKTTYKFSALFCQTVKLIIHDQKSSYVFQATYHFVVKKDVAHVYILNLSCHYMYKDSIALSGVMHNHSSLTESY